MSKSRILAAALTSLILSTCAAHAQTLTTLYNFSGGADGANPQTGVMYRGGHLYGTTGAGGNDDVGVAFKVNVAHRKEKVLYSFANGTDAGGPNSLILQGDTLYGTSPGGGEFGYGTVFEVNTKTGAETVLYSFTGGGDGDYPYGQLVYQDGLLYGVTYRGGDNPACGTVFTVDPATGTEAVLYNFQCTPDAYNPTWLISQGGNLYGTSWFGGSYNNGAVFKLAPPGGGNTNWTETLLHSFASGNDGALANNLIYHGGALYGTTVVGGAGNGGIVFKVNPTTGKESVVYSFTGPPDGISPNGVIWQGGNLYGTTEFGGLNQCPGNCGVIFKVNLATQFESVLFSFSIDGNGGTRPTAGLFYHNGVFFGTTWEGGTGASGTVFEFVP
jgi:uncharacterized repeat protein (TIGR03803 family)